MQTCKLLKQNDFKREKKEKMNNWSKSACKLAIEMCAVRCVVGGAKKKQNKKWMGKNLDNERIKGGKPFALT